MRVPLSWLREYALLPEPVDATEVARRLTAAGFEVESLESAGHDIRGLVIAQVLSIEELPHVIVPFKRDSYAKIVTAFRHLAKPL